MIDVSVIFLFNSKKEVLLQLRDNNPKINHPNIWGPLGGHREKGESIISCAKREFYEESGYKCDDLNFYEYHILPYDNIKVHRVWVHWSIYDKIQKIHCYEGQKIEFKAISELNKINISNKNKTIIKLINKLIN